MKYAEFIRRLESLAPTIHDSLRDEMAEIYLESNDTRECRKINLAIVIMNALQDLQNLIEGDED